MKKIRKIDQDSLSCFRFCSFSQLKYDILIVATGLEYKLDAIKGLQDALDDPNSMVGTIYGEGRAQKVKSNIDNFKGGKALFTQPATPIKCGGAPQKVWRMLLKQLDRRDYTMSCDIVSHKADFRNLLTPLQISPSLSLFSLLPSFYCSRLCIYPGTLGLRRKFHRIFPFSLAPHHNLPLHTMRPH